MKAYLMVLARSGLMSLIGGILVAAAFRVTTAGSVLAFGVTGFIFWELSIIEAVIACQDHARLLWEAASQSAWSDRAINQAQQVYISETVTTRVLILRLPVEPSKLMTIAASPEPFSENELVTKRRILSGREFRALQAEMIKRKFLEQRSPLDVRQGYKLTPLGWLAMSQIRQGIVKPEPVPLPLLTD